MSEWAFITNHGLVLATIAKHLSLTAREIADTIWGNILSACCVGQCGHSVEVYEECEV